MKEINHLLKLSGELLNTRTYPDRAMTSLESIHTQLLTVLQCKIRLNDMVKAENEKLNDWMKNIASSLKKEMEKIKTTPQEEE